MDENGISDYFPVHGGYADLYGGVKISLCGIFITDDYGIYGQTNQVLSSSHQIKYHQEYYGEDQAMNVYNCFGGRFIESVTYHMSGIFYVYWSGWSNPYTSSLHYHRDTTEGSHHEVFCGTYSSSLAQLSGIFGVDDQLPGDIHNRIGSPN